jgi:N-acetyl-anhydromuramyl-L-alanine amidase AmpD
LNHVVPEGDIAMMLSRTPIWRSLLLFVAIGLALHSAPRTNALAAEPDPATTQAAFAAAAQEFGVPERVLLAVSYNLSRWEDHNGEPSTSGGYGPMHLIDVAQVTAYDAKGDGKKRSIDAAALTAQQPTLQEAAKLLNVPVDVLKHDPQQNIRGGAALLAHYARANGATLPQNEADWYGAVTRYGGDPASAVVHQFAEDVYATLAAGESRITDDGQRITLAAGTVAPNRRAVEAPQAEASSTPDCPAELACRYAAAAYKLNNPEDLEDYGNYDLANREADGLDIKYLVIHDTETPYYDTIRYFQNPTAYASSHYVLRSSDGQITQMVDNRNVAWTAGNWYINAHSINFEHEGYAGKGASWYTEAMYRTSARLARYLIDKHHIPADRAHIIGHDEVPGTTPRAQTEMHWDPGPFWDWAHYMELINAPIRAQGNGTNRVVTIKPNFATNMQSFSDATTQSANMLYLRTAPSSSAPLLDDPAVVGTGSRSASDWGNKAVTGKQFYRFARQGDWDGIYYGGQQAWFYNPGQASTVASSGMLIKPKPGRSSIPVYGAAYPELEAYPPGVEPPESFAPLQYTIPAEQIYVAHERVLPTRYAAPTFTYDYREHTLVQGQDSYYAISFNHRLAFVKASDVDLVTGARPPMTHIFYAPVAGWK